MSQQHQIGLHVDAIIQDAIQNHTAKLYFNAKYSIVIIHTDPGAKKGEHLWFFDLRQRHVYSTQKSNELLLQYFTDTDNLNFIQIPKELYGIFLAFDYFLFRVQPLTANPLKAADFGSNLDYNCIKRIAKTCKRLSYMSYQLKEYHLSCSIAQHGINALTNHINQPQFKQTTSSQQQKEAQQLTAGLLHEMAVSNLGQKKWDKCIMYSKHCLSYAPNMDEAKEIYEYALTAAKKTKHKKSTSSSSSSSSSSSGGEHIIYCLRFAD